MGNTKIPEDKYQEVVDKYLSGISVNDLTEEYGVGRYAIYTVLKKMNIPRDKNYKVSNHRITKEEIPMVIELYKNGEYIKNISETYNITKDSIRETLKENNIEIGRFKKVSQFSEDEIKHIYDLYINGQSLEELGRTYGVDSSTISYLFKQRNYVMKTYSHANQHYHVNENYFDKIDTQNKAYVLGFLWSDGCNSSSRNSIEISLQEKDRHILEAMTKELDSDRPLRYINYKTKKDTYHNQYELAIYNEHMSKVLRDYGMVDRKSLVLEFPTCVPDKLISHFVRGYFDGNGFIPRKGQGYRATILGTENFCNSLQNILFDNGIESVISNTSNLKTSTRILSISREENSKLFFDYIYNDAELFLYRKHDIYLERYENLFDSGKPFANVANL